MKCIFKRKDIKDLIRNKISKDGSTLEEVMDFCDSVMFDESYSIVERNMYETIYKIFIFSSFPNFHTVSLQRTVSALATEHKIPQYIFDIVERRDMAVKHRNSFKYAKGVKKYNF